MEKDFYFDKSSLPKELQEKQKTKKTFDSPCMSVCNFTEVDGVLICGTCQMLREEKIEWKNTEDIGVKNSIAQNILKRRKS